MHRLLSMAAGIAAALAGLLAPTLATDDDFPTKPVTLIVPFQAGVSADLLLRGIAESASTRLGQPVIIDNKPGGSATLGPATMAGTAKPDGYTIGQIAIPVFRVPYMQKATFDPVKDFTYIIHGRLQSWCGCQSRRPVQEVAGRHRFCQGQSRQVHVHDDRRRYHRCDGHRS